MTHQTETKNPTLQAVKSLKQIGFDLVKIRKALPALTGISHPQAAHILGVSRQSVTSTMNAARGNVRMQARIADVYGVPVDEIFEIQCLCSNCRNQRRTISGQDNGVTACK